jgi:hypothetical protein
MINVDANMNIVLTKGDSAVLSLELKDGEGSTYDYSNDDVKFVVKRSPVNDNVVVLEKTVDEDGNIVLTPEDTNKLDGYGDFIYAIKVYHTVEAETEGEEDTVDVYTPVVARFSLGYNVI